MLTGVLVCIGLMAHGHPLHLSFTNLEFKTKNSHWELTIKVFSDDFAANIKEPAGSDQILNKWIGNNLGIWFDSKLMIIESWKFGGIRVKEDATWITYTFSGPLPVSEIKVKNTLLIDLYPDQKNLFVLVMGRFQFAYQFKKSDQETIFKLNK